MICDGHHYLLTFPVKVFKHIRGKLFALKAAAILFLEKCLSSLLVNYIAPYFFRNYTNIQPPERSKPHFLILRYRYYSQNRAMGDSTEKFMLDTTLAASQIATFNTMCYEDDLAPMVWGDLRFLAKCKQSHPSAIILSSWWYDRPNIKTLCYLCEKLHIPIVAIWWDTCWKDFFKSAEPVLPFIDVNVVPDNPNLHLIDHNSLHFCKFLPLWISLDPNIYKNKNEHRDIQICFLGQVDAYRDYRMEFIRYIKDNKIPIWLSTANRDRQPSHEEYVNIMRRSRIGINFSFSVDDHQLKGRVFETMMCGAMLMESENDQISKYFIPMQDYVSFSSKEDLVDKLRYYLSHEDERAEIAARGEKKAREYYNHTKFWEAILNKLGQVLTTRNG